jgi:hypothetical protein
MNTPDHSPFIERIKQSIISMKYLLENVKKYSSAKDADIFMNLEKKYCKTQLNFTAMCFNFFHRINFSFNEIYALLDLTKDIQLIVKIQKIMQQLFNFDFIEKENPIQIDKNAQKIKLKLELEKIKLELEVTKKFIYLNKNAHNIIDKLLTDKNNDILKKRLNDLIAKVEFNFKFMTQENNNFLHECALLTDKNDIYEKKFNDSIAKVKFNYDIFKKKFNDLIAKVEFYLKFMTQKNNNFLHECVLYFIDIYKVYIGKNINKKLLGEIQPILDNIKNNGYINIKECINIKDFIIHITDYIELFLKLSEDKDFIEFIKSLIELFVNSTEKNQINKIFIEIYQIKKTFIEVYQIHIDKKKINKELAEKINNLLINIKIKEWINIRKIKEWINMGKINNLLINTKTKECINIRDFIIYIVDYIDLFFKSNQKKTFIPFLKFLIDVFVNSRSKENTYDWVKDYKNNKKKVSECIDNIIDIVLDSFLEHNKVCSQKK